MQSSCRSKAPDDDQVLLRSRIAIAALLVLTFCLATMIHPTMTALHARNPRYDDPLASLMGDGRKLFANHFYVKADAYFHSGFYPSIFDNRESHQTPHMAEDAGVVEGRNTGDEEHFLGQASNWIDRHGRKHFPSVHTHLGDDSPDGHKNVEREILPWLRLSAELDPNKTETYTVAAFWLRRTGSGFEAEQFLREGLKLNPDNVEILFELGRCRFDAKDSSRARNLWELAWNRWQEQELGKPLEDQNRFLASQILIHLAVLESREANRERCLQWLERLVPLKSDPTEIQKRIVEVREGQTLGGSVLQTEPAPPAPKP